MFTRFFLSATLITLGLANNPASGQTKTGNGPRPSGQGADLVLVSTQINESAKTVAVTVRFDSQIGLRGVKVRLTVSGAGVTGFEQTKQVDMPGGTTRTVIFTNVNIAAMKAQAAQQPLQAARFLSLAARVDPDNAVGETNEGNNTSIRIIAAN